MASVADTGKGVLTVQTVSPVGSGTYKATKYFVRGNAVCGALCSVSLGCETTYIAIIWIPMQGKFTTIAILKSISHTSTKFRNLCAQDASNPFC